MKQKKYIIGGLVALGVIVVIAAIFFKVSNPGGVMNVGLIGQETSVADPVDIISDFYAPWLDAVKSTSTDPYTSGLASEKLLSEALRARLIGTEGHPDTEVDPVLCQNTIPERFTARVVSENEEFARVLIMAREKELSAQSVFTLKKSGDGWYIDDITCSSGEFEAPREFSYEKEGFLLKSVPPPYNPDNWHIVFEQDGQLGYVTPLFFDEESMCIYSGASETVCVPGEFTETSKIHVYGQMNELGAQVKRMEITVAE